MARIQQRYRSRLRFLAQRGFEPKIDHATGGYTEAKRGEAGVQAGHGFLGYRMMGSRRNMYEFASIIRTNNLRVGNGCLCNRPVVVATAAGNNHFGRLGLAFYRMENDVFLQHAIIAEGCRPRFKNVNLLNGQAGQKIFAERAEIRSVAKASRSDRHQLAAGSQQAVDEVDESRIEVAGFNAGRTQMEPLGRAGTDFSIGRIDDGGIKDGGLGAKQTAAQAGRYFLNKIRTFNREIKINACFKAHFPALLHGFGQGRMNQRVNFIERCFDRADLVFF